LKVDVQMPVGSLRDARSDVIGPCGVCVFGVLLERPALAAASFRVGKNARVVVARFDNNAGFINRLGLSNGRLPLPGPS
jgi:hypothetical protein